METGIVKWFNESRGYGFISPINGGDDLFAHYSAIEMEGYRTLREGQRVQYEPVEGPVGPEALKIRRVA